MANLLEDIPLKKTDLPLPAASNCRSLVLGIWCRTLVSVLRFVLVWACTGLVHAVTTAESSYMQRLCSVQRSWFPCSHLPPVILKTFSPEISMGREYDYVFHLGLGIVQLLSPVP